MVHGTLPTYIQGRSMTFIPIGMKIAFSALFLWWLLITVVLVRYECHREKAKFFLWLVFGLGLFLWALNAVTGKAHPLI